LTDSRLYLAIVHYPVYNKHREIITTSIVIHDIHDIARAGKTYGARAVYEVEPLPQEQEIALRIAQFWNEGFGREYNPNRAESLSLLHIVTHLKRLLQKSSTWNRKNLFLWQPARVRSPIQLGTMPWVTRCGREIILTCWCSGLALAWRTR